jgi:hypothetical protein
MRKKKLYVVGYDFDHNCVYGEDDEETGKARYTQPMAATRAEQYLKEEMLNKGAVIYKLVKVDPKTLEVKK